MVDAADSDRRASVLAAFGMQIGWCESLGSPLTAAILTLLAEDITARGSMTADFAEWPGDPLADALALRVAGALHALVLTGEAPALAACYPPGNAPGLAAALQDTMAQHAPFIRAFLASPPQTNEVGRSAVLVGGFLRIAAETRQPLRLLEIGASAGLNLVWDKYRYRLGSADWGDPSSELLLAPRWQGNAPPLAEIEVCDRRACDVAPIDVHDPAQRLRLRSYVWADQPDRLARLDHAIGIARAAGHRVERADAAHWVAERLQESRPGCTTVLYHSIMWQYMPAETRSAITAAMAAAGARATPDAPLAWLRFEPPDGATRPELSLTLWPGRREVRLAQAHPHGSEVHWLDEPTQ